MQVCTGDGLYGPDSSPKSPPPESLALHRLEVVALIGVPLFRLALNNKVDILKSVSTTVINDLQSSQILIQLAYHSPVMMPLM